MNIIDSTTLRKHLSDVIKENKDYLLVSKRGEVKSALLNIDFFEELLTLKEYLESIKKAKEDHKEGRTLTHEEVSGER